MARENDPGRTGPTNSAEERHEGLSATSADSTRTEEFVSLLAEHRDELFRFVLSILPHHAEAEDVFQRTSVVLWRKFDEFQPGTNFLRWAARVAHFEVRDQRKRLGRDRLQFWTNDLVDAVADMRLENDELLQQQRRALSACLKKLSQRDRELIELRYSTQTTSKELAARLGRPLVSVYKALARIRRALYECIERTLAPERRY